MKNQVPIEEPPPPVTRDPVCYLPWYRSKRIWVMGLSALLLLVLLYMFHRPIEVTRGPWQVLDPGKPVEPLKFEVVEEETGSLIESGDLILVSMWYWSSESNEIERRNDDWWIWVGFRTEKETPFHSINLRLISAFVGLREGGVKFLEKPSHSSSAEVYVNPLGSKSRYYNGVGSISAGKKGRIYFPYSSGYTVVHIKKVFKGQLKYRTTHVYDDTWFRRCYNWFSCEYTNTPRENWYDDALYEGVSADGQRATFQYGPVSAPRQPRRSSGDGSMIESWAMREWEHLPVGVQVK